MARRPGPFYFVPWWVIWTIRGEGRTVQPGVATCRRHARHVGTPDDVPEMRMAKSTQLRQKDIDETLAQAAIKAALGIDVQIVDDGSKPAMYDLEADLGDGRTLAAEVTSTRDPLKHMLIDATIAKGHVPTSDLHRTWVISVKHETRVNALTKVLPALLKKLEDDNIESLTDNGVPRPLAKELRNAGIDFCMSSTATKELPPGYRLTASAWYTFQGSPDGLVQRLDDFVTDESQSDVLAKLRASSADERHFVVIITWDWLEYEGLVRHGSPLPDLAPQLPEDLDGLWAIVEFAGPTRGIYWQKDRGWAEVWLNDWIPQEWLKS